MPARRPRHSGAGAVGLSAGIPTWVIVGGPPGAGKTTVAAALAAALGWTLIRSDVVRREVVGAERWGGSPEWLSSRFSPQVTQATYREMVRRARRLLDDSASPIIDATWATEAVRGLARLAARDTGSAFVALHCTAPRRVAEDRVARRIAAGPDISNATVAIVRRIAGTFAPWPSASSIDTAAPIAETLAAALSAVRGHRAVWTLAPACRSVPAGR